VIFFELKAATFATPPARGVEAFGVLLGAAGSFGRAGNL
jgi:hypothetical protein